MSVKRKIMLVSALAVGAATVLLFGSDDGITPRIKLGEHVFEVLVADSDTTRIRGLSGRPSLSNGQAMLFVFPNDGTHGIWMKDMRFAIDILWVDRDGTIVHIEQEVRPDSYPNVFTSMVQARYVIEVNAGVVQELGIDVGQHMETWLSG